MNQSIYIKTEPGGTIYFGGLNENLAEPIRLSVLKRELTPEIQALIDEPYLQLMEYRGVSSAGDTGQLGNIGVIDLSESACIPSEANNSWADGFYLLIADLSKVSLEFDLELADDFDPSLLVEHSIKVSIPEQISHPIYGAFDFNLVISYSYDGSEISRELTDELVDRGYERLISLFLSKNNVITELYQAYRFDEIWRDIP